MKGKPKELILSVNVLPNGKHIGQLQKRTSTKLNNHATNGGKNSEISPKQRPWAKNGLRFILQ
jgi:hypothetical protein